MTYISFKPVSPTAVRPKDIGVGWMFSADLGIGSHTAIFQQRRLLISTGIQIGLPHGTVMQLSSRGAVATKYGISVLAGIVGPEDREELRILLLNQGSSPYKIVHGQEIAFGFVTMVAPLKAAHLGPNDTLGPIGLKTGS